MLPITKNMIQEIKTKIIEELRDDDGFRKAFALLLKPELEAPK